MCNRQNTLNYCENNIIGPIYNEQATDSTEVYSDAFFISNYCKPENLLLILV